MEKIFNIKCLNGGKNPLFRVLTSGDKEFNVTYRQIEITKLASEGLTEEETASALGISKNTVKKIKQLSFEQTEVASTTELTVFFDQLGLIWPISMLGLKSLADGNRNGNKI